MNVQTKLIICGVVLIVVLGLIWRLQVVENQRDKAKTDAWAYFEVAKKQWLYIDQLGKEQDIAMAKDAQNQEEARNVKNDGCNVMPVSFRNFVDRLQ